MPLLIGKNLCLSLVEEVIEDHAPYRSVTRTGGIGNNLYSMLTIKDIVDTIAPADFDWIDLVEVKVLI